MPRVPIRGYGGSPARLVVRGYGVRPTNLPLPPIDGTTFWDSLRAYLKARGELAEITEVYFRRTKPNPSYPYIVVAPIGDSPEINNSELYWESSDVSFSVVTTGPECDEDAERLGQAAYRALAPKQRNDAGVVVSRPKITSTYAYEMTAIPGQKFRMEQPGRGPLGQPVFAFQFKYRFLVGRSMVGN